MYSTCSIIFIFLFPIQVHHLQYPTKDSQPSSHTCRQCLALPFFFLYLPRWNNLYREHAESLFSGTQATRSHFLLLFLVTVMSDSFAALWTVNHQAPLSVGFHRQEYWSGLPFPPPGFFPTQESNPCPLCFLHWQMRSLPLSHLGNPRNGLPFTVYYFLSNFCFVVRISFPGFHPFASFQLGETVCIFKLNFKHDLICETSSKSSRQYGKCAINLFLNYSIRDTRMNKFSTDRKDS